MKEELELDLYFDKGFIPKSEESKKDFIKRCRYLIKEAEKAKAKLTQLGLEEVDITDSLRWLYRVCEIEPSWIIVARKKTGLSNRIKQICCAFFLGEPEPSGTIIVGKDFDQKKITSCILARVRSQMGSFRGIDGLFDKCVINLPYWWPDKPYLDTIKPSRFLNAAVGLCVGGFLASILAYGLLGNLAYLSVGVPFGAAGLWLCGLGQEREEERREVEWFNRYGARILEVYKKRYGKKAAPLLIRLAPGEIINGAIDPDYLCNIDGLRGEMIRKYLG